MVELIRREPNVKASTVDDGIYGIKERIGIDVGIGVDMAPVNEY